MPRVHVYYLISCACIYWQTMLKFCYTENEKGRIHMKKIISVLVATALLLACIGCGGETGETLPTGTQGTTAVTTLPTATTIPTRPGETTLPPTLETTLPTAPVETTVPPITMPPTTAPVDPVPPTTEQTAPPPTTEETTPPSTPPTQPQQGDSQCEHRYTSRVTTRASCTTEGLKTHTCYRCGYTYTETIEAKGHAYTAATCEKAQTCERCGDVVGKALGHDYGSDWRCSRCGKTDPAIPRDYTISICGKNGKPLVGVKVDVYSDSSLRTLIASAATNQQGILTLELPTSWGYHAVVSGYDASYTAAASYPLTGDDISIVLNSNADQNFSGKAYKVGQTIADFTVYDVDGNRYDLAQLRSSKELVILNFWYCSCGPCKAEFPHMDEVYKEYGDRIEILALDHFDGDSLAKIREIRQEIGVSFPMIRESMGFGEAFDLQGYPTTVILDSTGKILHIRSGSFADGDEFVELLEKYL